MSRRRGTVIASAMALTFCAVAMAAALPTAHTRYFYLKSQRFSITLTTTSAKQIAAAKPQGASGVLVVCPPTSTGSVNEVQMGFPGVRLKLSKGQYGFRITYTEKHADVVTIKPVFGHVTHEPATATVTGTVESSRLIAGTVSVSAAGCRLPKAHYKAAAPQKSA